MKFSSRLARALLITTTLAAPTLAFGQVDPGASEPPTGETVAQPPAAPAAEGALPEEGADAAPQEEEVDVSIPGGNEIVVTGARDRNIAKSSDQVVSVLSSAEIARTGEGNIAGALSRVTGLSVVGNGLVYVRGLGDRYSLTLLNGSPLPSPEPLRRVVPLDLFPSGVIASSLVQKSYSVNYPGEFGGGVINLTTKAVPRDPFLTIGFGVSGDTETTGQLGYTYLGGGDSDTSGFDDGTRDIPPALAAFLKSGDRLSDPTVDSRLIASQLVNFRNGIVQRIGEMPANVSASLSAGKSFPVGDGELGVISALGYSNKYTTRDSIQQNSQSADLAVLEEDFRQVNTDQRIVVNALFGLGLEIGDSKVRWTNLFIRDTIKQARLALGSRNQSSADVLRQRTGWFERQLIDTHMVGEFKLAPEINLDLRAGYSNSQREAPDELTLDYVRSNSASDQFGNFFVNRLNGGNGGRARIVFSDLNEDLVSGGADLSFLVVDSVTGTIGAAYSDARRDSSRREFEFRPGNLPDGVSLFRPDFLLQPSVINEPTFRFDLDDNDEGTPAFTARLRNYAGYIKGNWQITDTVSLDAGVRYEDATQQVDPIQVFNSPGASTTGTSLKNDYWLPAGTLTWQIQPDMQVRLSASKTIARPQFRELIFQFYFDPDSNRQYRGNPLLFDSRLTNAEARYEWYFAPEQRASISGFYKRIKNPIEAYLTGGDLVTSYANAPEATLYGAEIEFQKYFDLSDLGSEGGFFTDRRAILIGNYTYTKSDVKVDAGDKTLIFGAGMNGVSEADDYFRDGSPLTGQSDHIANLQLGLENTERLSQQTILLSYASGRATSRGLSTPTQPQPDVIEKPGFRIDFVAREGIDVLGKQIELKFEARNITGQKHEEFQQSGTNRVDFNTYHVGTTLALSASVNF